MNANEITFGIEIETTLPSRDTTPIGRRHAGLPVEWLPAGWRAEEDSSIHSQQPGRKGCEFVSPKLKGTEGLDQVMAAATAIYDRGGRVNHTCGVHITVSFPNNAKALARLITLVANHERAIYASTGTKRRERGGYCKSVKAIGNKTVAERWAKNDRYHGLNLANFDRGGRVEFRFFSASLNPVKLAAWIQMVLGLVEMAINTKRESKWDYRKQEGKKSAWDAATDAETEVNRLFYKLGWTKGHTNNPHGLVALVPTVETMKAEVRRLARKYETT